MRDSTEVKFRDHKEEAWFAQGPRWRLAKSLAMREMELLVSWLLWVGSNSKLVNAAGRQPGVATSKGARTATATSTISHPPKAGHSGPHSEQTSLRSSRVSRDHARETKLAPPRLDLRSRASPNIAVATNQGQLRGIAAFSRALQTIASMASPLSAVRSARQVAHNVAGKRLLSDIAITRTGKPIIRLEGGR